MRKLLFIDTETTGIDPKTAGVWQIGGIIECGKRSEEFLLECDIFENDVVEKSATELTGITTAKLSTLPDPADVFDRFISILDKYVDRFDKKDKFTVVGYFSEFDQQVLRKWFEENDDSYFGSWFWHPWIDVAQMVAVEHLDKRDTIQNFRLQTIAEFMGIKYDGDGKFHDALFDAQIARQIFHKIF
jgi:DNA polymerase-3 subunit epsilon